MQHADILSSSNPCTYVVQFRVNMDVGGALVLAAGCAFTAVSVSALCMSRSHKQFAIAGAVGLVLSLACIAVAVALIASAASRSRVKLPIANAKPMVGITTTPVRFNSDAFQSSLQSVVNMHHVHAVVLTLPLANSRGDPLQYDTAKMQRLQHEYGDKLIIHRPSTDHGPIMKLLGLLEYLSTVPEHAMRASAILLADDDVVYEANAPTLLLETLARHCDIDGAGYAGRKSNAELEHVATSDIKQSDVGTMSDLAFLETYALVAYTPRALRASDRSTILALQQRVEHARYTDDITIGKHLRDKGIRITLVASDKLPIVKYIDYKGGALRDHNVSGRNVQVYRQFEKLL